MSWDLGLMAAILEECFKMHCKTTHAKSDENWEDIERKAGDRGSKTSRVYRLH